MVRRLHDPRPSMRLIAATALANLYRSGAIPDFHSEITMHVLPALVKLFAEATAGSSILVQEKVPLVLAYLVSESEELQKAAADADAIPKLAAILSSLSGAEGGKGDAAKDASEATASTSNDRLRESVLLAIAAVCSLKEECRKQVSCTSALCYLASVMRTHTRIHIHFKGHRRQTPTTHRPIART